MRGNSFCHRAILTAIARLAEKRGARVQPERAVWLGSSFGFVDLVIRWKLECLAIEAEQSPRRVHNDLLKAVALKAKWLFIVTPTAGIARACSSEVVRCKACLGDVQVTVCTLGMALHSLSTLLTPTNETNLDPPATSTLTET